MAFAAFLPELGRAASTTWTGATSTDWNTAGNWGVGGIPVAGADATFGSVATTRFTADIATTGTVKFVTFATGANSGAFTISGVGNLTIGNALGITNSSGFQQTINVATLTLSSAETFDAGTVAGGSLSFGGTTINLGASQTLTVTGTNNTTIGDAIIGTGTSGITKTGTGTLTLTGASTYTGADTVSVGVLNIQNATALGTTAAGTTVTAGAAMQVQGNIAVGAEALNIGGTGIASDGALRNISGNNSFSGAITLSAATFIGSDAGTLTLSGVISDGGGKFLLTKVGAGELILSGNNSFQGFTLNAGRVGIGSATALGGTKAITINAGDIYNSSGGALTIAQGPLIIGGDFTISGAQDLTFSQGEKGSGAPVITVSNTGLTTFSGVLADNGTALTLTKAGAGTLALTGVNTYTGGTIINAGTVAVNSATSFGATAGAVTLNAGTVEVTTGFSTTRVYTLGNTASTFQIDSLQTFTDSTAIGGTGALNKTGTGMMITSAVNTYSGGTVVSAGTLQLSGSGTLGSTSGSLTVNGGTLDLNGTNQTVGALNGSGGTILDSTATAKTLTVGTGNGSGSYAGVIANGTGTVALTKTGSGSQTLTGANTYTGATTVNAGALFVNGSTAAGSAVTVNSSGSTLGGSGTIGGSVNVASGANLSPGASGIGSTAILHTGSLTLASGSNFTIDINSNTAGSGYDQLSVLGALSITGSNLVITAGSGLSIGQKFFIALNDSTDSITGTFAQGASVTASNNSDIFSISYVDNGDSGSVGNDISLTVVAVPEPSTYAAAILTLAVLAYHQRKRFKKFFSL